MTALTSADLRYREATRIVHDDAPVDKSYRKFPIGQEVGRYLRAMKVERDFLPNTVRSYEPVLAKFTLRFAFMDSLEPFAERGRGPDLIVGFLDDLWGDLDADTIRHRRAVLASFFGWAFETDRISADPMRKVKRSRRRNDGAKRERVPGPHVGQLVSAQSSLRDQAAILLLARLALRREDLRLLQLRDIDLGRDEIRLLHSKGGTKHTLPIKFPDVRQTLLLHLSERDGQPSEYLIYPKTHRLRALSAAGIDNWFQRCVTRAELPHYTMHQLRHAAIDDVRRGTGDYEMARQLARHASADTTQTYLHSTLDDLRAAIEGMGDV